MTFTKPALLAALCLGLTAPAALADDTAPCKLHRIAYLDMQQDTGGLPAVPVTIAGQQRMLVVDMGSQYSALTATKAKAMGLQLAPMPARIFRMFDGSYIEDQAFAPGFMIGQIPLPNYTFMILPDNELDTSVDGLIGVDILSHLDIEFDFSKMKMSLFVPSECGDKVVYWGGAFARLPIKFDDALVGNAGQAFAQNHVNITGTLDGADVKMTVDTGSSYSIMTLQQAELALGWRTLPAGLEKHAPVRGNDVYVYPFKTLTLDGITVTNPKVLIMDVPHMPASENTDMVLGMDILRRLHLYVSYAHKTLYMTAASPAPVAPATAASVPTPTAP